MKNVIKGLGVAAILTFGATEMAAADAASMMQGYGACNSEYQACLSGGTDATLASTPQEGMSKMEMNAQNAMGCAQALQACYGSVQ